MKNRLKAIVLTAAAALGLCGCGRMLDTEYVVETSYAPVLSAADPVRVDTTVASLEDLKQVLLDMVAEGTRPSYMYYYHAGHFPAKTCNPSAIRADGIPAAALVSGIGALIDLDRYATPVIMMAPVPGDELDPAVEASYREALGGYSGEVLRLPREEFYARAKAAFAVVQSGETAQYGNVILKKGNAL